MPKFNRRVPLNVSLKTLKIAIQNEENAGFLLRQLSVTANLEANQLVVEEGDPPEDEIEVQDLGPGTEAEASEKMTKLHNTLPGTGGVIAWGELSIEGKLTWVAAFRRKGAATVSVPQSGGTVPRLPDYAKDLLSPEKGVPWAKAKPIAGGDNYEGCFPKSLHLFEDLRGIPGGGTTALFYESKFSIDNDGIGGNDAGDQHHQGQTSLRDGLGTSLDAGRDAFGVIPMDKDEAQKAHNISPGVKLKQAGLPDLSDALGLKIGDLGVAFWREKSTGETKQAFFIYADKGPANRLGEGSVKMAELLDIHSNPTNGGFQHAEMIKMGKGVIHIAFPGSGAAFTDGNKSRLVPNQIKSSAIACFEAFLRQPATSITAPQDLQGKLSDRVPIPAAGVMNVGLTPASEKTMIDRFGMPGLRTANCSEPSSGMKALLVSNVDVGPFKVTGMKAAVESLQRIFAEVKVAFPQVFAEVSTEGLGMLCVRHRRGDSARFSNHSWGSAIDLKFGDKEVPLGTNAAQRGFLALFPIFNKEGWYWGAEFSGDSVDSMHFELSEEFIAKMQSPT